MRKIIALTLFVLLYIGGCGKKSSPDPTPDVIPVPAKTSLLAPITNSTCTTGKVISNTQSVVTFSWNSTANTESYDLTVRNLLTQAVTTQNTAATQLDVTLDRSTPYSWYVVSKTSKTTTTTSSDIFKFYNSGIAATNYAPFPADLTSPTFNQSINAAAGKVTLTWTGADVDSDIAGYDVYIGTTQATMAVVSTGQTAGTYNAIVTSGNIYYWKVATKDSQANISYSVTGQFFVN